MSAAVTIPRPSVAFWNKGRRPEEQGYLFDGVSVSLSDLTSCKSFVDLQNKGVPVFICEAAKRAGYMPSEIDEFLDETT